jgi:hypothetical protein
MDESPYLAWWKGNDKLKNKEVMLDSSAESIRFQIDRGVVLEGEMALPAGLMIGSYAGQGFGILVDEMGITEIGPIRADWTGFKCEERADREMPFRSPARFRLLLRRTMLEFHLDDILIRCYTMQKASNGEMSL